MSGTTQHLHEPHPKKRGIFLSRVTGNAPICEEHRKLTLQVSPIENQGRRFPESVPGQFVQLECGPACQTEQETLRVVEWNPDQPVPVGGLGGNEFTQEGAFLRRPFSLAGRHDGPEGTDLDVIYRVVGKGTKYLSELRQGDKVSVLGPLGNGFVVDEEVRLAVLVGGGVGVPPMIYLGESLGSAAVAIVGAQRKELLAVRLREGVEVSTVGEPRMCVEEFAQAGIPTVVTSDDGSVGMKGFVTEGLRRLLANETPQGVTVYCCGPTGMMRAVAKVCAEYRVRCQVSLEQPMACGMGTCQSCVIRWRKNGEGEWVYKLACTDGPVFEAKEIVWDRE